MLNFLCMQGYCHYVVATQAVCVFLLLAANDSHFFIVLCTEAIYTSAAPWGIMGAWR